MKKTFYIVALGASLTFSACEKTLEVLPRQSIDSKIALNSKDGIEAALLGVYDVLQSTDPATGNPTLYGRDLIAIPEALADNGEATNKSGRLQGEFLNQPNAHFNNWILGYRGINNANLILDALKTNAANLAAANKDAIEGQASFLRALFYFDLARVYGYDPQVELAQVDKGCVPLIVSGITAVPQIESAKRAKNTEVYAQIYKDLDVAVAKLGTTNFPHRATKVGAQALYSRVALYNKDYNNTVKYATDALATHGNRLQSTANYVSAWRAAIHPESLFEVAFQANENIGVNTSLQTTYSTLLAVGDRSRTGGFGDLVPTASLLAAFETNDVRRNLYELGTTGRGTARIECTKFLGKGGQPNLDNVPVIRVSELYLNRAEANYMLKKETEALADLNIIRKRAGLAEVTLTGDALFNEILKQRRVELAFEGHRWFDLKRRGQDIVKAVTIPYTDFRILPPIPVRDLQANPNLVQNDGY